MKITKTLSEKEIEKLSGILEQVGTLTCEKHWVDGAELIAQGHTHDHNNIPFVIGRKYQQNFPVVMAINHKRIMKKLFKRYGDQGVLQYVLENQKNKIIKNETASKN